jgi:hypothetical protein
MFHHRTEKLDPMPIRLSMIQSIPQRKRPVTYLFTKYSANDALLHSAIRVFQSMLTAPERIVAFGHYFVAIDNHEHISEMLNSQLEALFPTLYSKLCQRFATTNNSFVLRLAQFWKTSSDEAVRCCSSLSSDEILISSSELFILRESMPFHESQMKVWFRRLCKGEMNEFSIWAHKKVFPTQIRCSFRYASNFSQIRIRKSYPERAPLFNPITRSSDLHCEQH